MSRLGIRLRRRRLWERSPLCRRCGVETVLPDGILEERDGRKYLPKPIPRNLATIQHYDSRLSPLRGSFAGEERTTLWCWRCNNRDGAKEQAGLPLAELHERSGRHPS